MLDYLKPTTLEEVFTHLDRLGSDALLLAGGTDLFLKVKKGKLTPSFLISLQRIPELNFLREDKGLFIGATTTHRTIEKYPYVRKHYPALADAEDVLGSVQIRNVGTIGGNLCNAAPSADTAPPLLVLGAQIHAVSKQGERTIPLEDFFQAPGKTVLTPGEIVNFIEIPAPKPYTSSAYFKHQRRQALDLPLLGVAVQITLDRDLGDITPSLSATWWDCLKERKVKCLSARIALGVAAPTPMRAFNAEGVLQGEIVTEEVIEEAARTAQKEASPRDSLRGEAWYRREMIGLLVKRMIVTSLLRLRR